MPAVVLCTFKPRDDLKSMADVHELYANTLTILYKELEPLKKLMSKDFGIHEGLGTNPPRILRDNYIYIYLCFNVEIHEFTPILLIPI